MSNYAKFLLDRMDGVGGSDVAGILGISPYASPLDVFASKMILPEPGLDEPQWLEWGKILEPVIANYYENNNGKGHYLTVCDKTQINTETPWMRANIDRWVQYGNADDHRQHGTGICEIKNVSAYAASDWKDGPPLHYQLQMQFYLHCTGCSWGVFVLFLGNECRWVDVERDDETIAMIIEATREFWERVKADSPPLADGHKKTREAIYKLYPQDDETDAIALSDECTGYDGDIQDAQAIVKEQEEIIEKNKNLLRQAIGKSTLGVLEGERGAWSFKTRKDGVRALKRKGD